MLRGAAVGQGIVTARQKRSRNSGWGRRMGNGCQRTCQGSRCVCRPSCYEHRLQQCGKTASPSSPSAAGAAGQPFREETRGERARWRCKLQGTRATVFDETVRKTSKNKGSKGSKGNKQGRGAGWEGRGRGGGLQQRGGVAAACLAPVFLRFLRQMVTTTNKSARVPRHKKNRVVTCHCHSKHQRGCYGKSDVSQCQ